MLLDFMLPELDGLSVCRAIKSNPSLRHIKVLMLTARTDEEVKLQALDYGADDFLTKPFSPAEVRTRVRNLLQTHDLEQSLRGSNRDLADALSGLKESQQQLIQSEKINSLGHMAAGLLHEINNPLNYAMTALGYANTLPAVKQDAMLREIVDDATEGMGRIGGIVSDLRAFAYPSNGAIHQAFDLSSAVTKAMRFTAADTSEVTVNNEVIADLLVLGSESHIVQVLVNLITNAAKATAGCGNSGDSGDRGHLIISAERSEHGERIEVLVRDNGIGMDTETLNHCMDPFFTTRDVGEGMGMGLAICRTIIEEHGGQLTVAATQIPASTSGTTVSFDLERG